MTGQSNFNDDQAIIDAGYKPQLKRSLGIVSSFAVVFSAMSVLMGVFANFGFALTKAGPFGFWTWPIVGCGQLLVGLACAELAARMPLTGAIYNWNNCLINPAIGWLSAWLLLVSYILGSVGLFSAIIAPLQTLLGRELGLNELRALVIAMVMAQAFINIYGVRLAAYTNKIAVFTEIAVLVVFGFVLLVVMLINHSTHPELLTYIPSTQQSYWPGFILASLMAGWTFLGFECSSDLSEETINTRAVTPKGIIWAFGVSVLMGFFFIAVLAMGIPDLAEITAANDPISAIVGYHLGNMAARILAGFVVIAIFAVMLLFIAAPSRVIFAMARDKRLPCSLWLTKVSKHHTPVMAILLVAVVQIAIFLIARDAVDLFASTTILYYLVYLITISGFALGYNKLPPSTTFSLGRWRKPVIVMAIVWLIAEIGVLTLPADFHNAAFISVGVIILGCILYVSGRFYASR